jgi:hypothetical protein
MLSLLLSPITSKHETVLRDEHGFSRDITPNKIRARGISKIDELPPARQPAPTNTKPSHFKLFVHTLQVIQYT